MAAGVSQCSLVAPHGPLDPVWSPNGDGDSLSTQYFGDTLDLPSSWGSPLGGTWVRHGSPWVPEGTLFGPNGPLANVLLTSSDPNGGAPWHQRTLKCCVIMYLGPCHLVPNGGTLGLWSPWTPGILGLGTQGCPGTLLLADPVRQDTCRT